MKAILKRNKALFVLPLVLIPFVVLIFYVLGGGENVTGKKQKLSGLDPITGANYNLPEADRSLEIVDKMEVVESADKISLYDADNILGVVAKDNEDSLKVESEAKDTSQLVQNATEFSGIMPESHLTDQSDLLKHIQHRQQQIRSTLRAGKDEAPNLQSKAEPIPMAKKSGWAEDTTSKAKQTNPELTMTEAGIEQLDQVFRENAYLKKRNDSLSSQLRQAQVIQQKQDSVRKHYTVLEKQGQSAFKPGKQTGSMLKAEIYESATVLTGNRIKLRLLEDGWLGGVKIPKGAFLYGLCEVAGERLKITIRQIPLNGNLIPVNITACDLDGMAGLYVPDHAARKVAKNVGGGINTSSMFGVTGNPLTYAGVQAADQTARSLIRMVRIKKVTVRKNTLVYLSNKPK
ncbi:conjugative transposon protein TraM [Sunxiuqinia indica]|uniref:conjugative transposon protein TraM n=1 Tax=Sunxiuqinia indica TaxID=2692584 RepID=UPI001357DF36|nr:conjugative transposon protein TraM [Sunxiuqinia indica]